MQPQAAAGYNRTGIRAGLANDEAYVEPQRRITGDPVKVRITSSIPAALPSWYKRHERASGQDPNGDEIVKAAFDARSRFQQAARASRSSRSTTTRSRPTRIAESGR